MLISARDAAGWDCATATRWWCGAVSASMRGRAHLAPVKPGVLQVHWPEGNALLDRSRRSKRSGIPDYNAVVRLEPAGSPGSGEAGPGRGGGK